jgi:hypothetical protein
LNRQIEAEAEIEDDQPSLGATARQARRTRLRQKHYGAAREEDWKCGIIFQIVLASQFFCANI